MAKVTKKDFDTVKKALAEALDEVSKSSVDVNHVDIQNDNIVFIKKEEFKGVLKPPTEQNVFFLNPEYDEAFYHTKLEDLIRERLREKLNEDTGDNDFNIYFD